MTHVIAQSCCSDTACVDACPVDAIHPRPDEAAFVSAEMLYIDPVSCIDCGACIDVCPVDAIETDLALRSGAREFERINRMWFDVAPEAVETVAPGPGA